VVNLGDLYLALKENVIQAAGLDVLEIEPPSLSEPLIFSWKEREPWLYNRLCITPHAAFFTGDSFKELKHKGWEIINNFFMHGKIQNCVNAGSHHGAK
jgi:D-3-phosphoglycerate dehydrogenase